MLKNTKLLLINLANQESTKVISVFPTHSSHSISNAHNLVVLHLPILLPPGLGVFGTSDDLMKFFTASRVTNEV